MKVNSLYIFSLLLILISCSKDNLSASRLEGEWNLVSMTFDGVEAINTNTEVSYTFLNIDRKTGNYKTSYYILNSLIAEFSGSFTISGDGTFIRFKENGNSISGPGMINELNEDFFKISYTDADETYIVLKAEKK